jgi:hypothetical protein
MIKKLYKAIYKKLSFKLLLYIIFTIFAFVVMMGFDKFLRIILGIFLLYRFIILVAHGWFCPTCIAKFGVAIFFFILVLLGTTKEALVLFLVLIWLDYFFLKKE